VADVTDAILGADFINHFGLIVDLRAKKLYSQDRAETTNGRVKPTNQFGIRAIFDSGRAFPTIAAKIPGRPSWCANRNIQFCTTSKQRDHRYTADLDVSSGIGQV
jgi:hypothetical protein